MPVDWKSKPELDELPDFKNNDVLLCELKTPKFTPSPNSSIGWVVSDSVVKTFPTKAPIDSVDDLKVAISPPLLLIFDVVISSNISVSNLFLELNFYVDYCPYL